jgi:hypothetical protein
VALSPTSHKRKSVVLAVEQEDGLFDDDVDSSGDGYESDPDGLFAENEEVLGYESDPDGLFAENEELGYESDPDGLFDEGKEVAEVDDEVAGGNLLVGSSYPAFTPVPKRKKGAGLPPVTKSTGGKIPVLREIDDHSFVRWMWPDRVLIREGKLSDASEGLVETFENDGTIYSLLAVKIVDNTLNCSTWTYRVWRAFYIKVSGPGVQESLDLKLELDKIADFQRLPPRKIVSRLELFISPAAYSNGGKARLALQFHLDIDQLEIIAEDSNVGCGFIGDKLLERLLGEGSIAATAGAVQVRIVAPALGIFKGMLMRKTGITGIQLPSSMQKVGRSKSRRLSFDGAYVLFNAVFPSKTCDMMGRYLHPKLKNPPDSFEKELRPLGLMVEKILLGLGVQEDVISLYADECCSWSEKRRNHAYCVGVADPTDALPEGTVFVTGMDVGSPAKKVFLTRNPCTEAADGKLLTRITKKPKQMKKEDWQMLCSLRFGIVIFARPPDGTKPLPETIAAGDLDGDLYLVCWDDEIISLINPAATEPIATYEEVETDDDDPLLKVSYLQTDEDGKSCEVWVREKVGDQYIVSYADGRTETVSKKEVIAGRDFVDDILSHRGGKGTKKPIEVQILWNSGKKEWVKQWIMRREIPDALFVYAKEHELTETSGWTWVKSYVRDAEIQEILGHKSARGKKEPAKLCVKWDDGTTEWMSVKDLKPEDNDTLDVEDKVVNYAKHEKILGWKAFGWAKGYIGMCNIHLFVPSSVSLC